MSRQDSVERARQVREWLESARDGSKTSLGHLLETCRNYLLLIANESLDQDLRGKVSPSDLVQDTFLRAQDHWSDFQGGSEDELLAWLRQILVNRARDARRDFNAQKRDVDREGPERPSQLPDKTKTPSAVAMDQEQQAAMQRALAQLPEDYRRVVVMRNWERRSFKEIGAELGRSPEAARKLWARAVEKLQGLMENPPSGSS